MKLRSNSLNILYNTFNNEISNKNTASIEKGDKVKLVLDLSEGSKKRYKSFIGIVMCKEKSALRIIRVDGHKMEIKVDTRSKALVSISKESVQYKLRKAKPYYMRYMTKKSLKSITR